MVSPINPHAFQVLASQKIVFHISFDRDDLAQAGNQTTTAKFLSRVSDHWITDPRSYYQILPN